jgi:hypothetical protein
MLAKLIFLTSNLFDGGGMVSLPFFLKGK